MKILVVSDTHRNTGRFSELMQEFSKKISAVIHLGDNVGDVDFIKKNYRLPVYAVAGNCDYGGNIPHEVLLHIGGKRVFFTHGHYYNVRNNNVETLAKRALEVEADICLYGHTHIPSVQVRNGIIFFNPGSLSEPRGNSRPSYGIIKIEDDKILPMAVPFI